MIPTRVVTKMLSNTATPIYYGEFRNKVLSGEIPVCKTIEMEMNRIDSLIADPHMYYDDKAINGFISFCENELTLTDGSDLKLLDTFKLWAESIFGWYYFVQKEIWVPDETGGGHWEQKIVKRRLVKKQYLIVARGAAKSLYESCLQSYFLNVDTSTTHQVTTAPTMRQAEEVMSPIKTAITRSRGPLFTFLTQGSINNTKGNRKNRPQLLSTKKGIENNLTGSLLEIRPMKIDKLQGLRSKYNTVDEWLSGDIREDPVGALEQGASKNNDYLIVAVSSEGTVRNAAGDTIKMELMKILKGEYYAPQVSIWYYRLDTVEEVGQPEMWLKAQPNLGKTVSYETYQQEVERAENSPSARNDILAKRFGLPMEGYTYFFSYEDIQPTSNRTDFLQLPCAMGGDLSQGDDFCAFTFLMPLGGEMYGMASINFITEYTYDRLPGAIKQKYKEFEEEGTLTVLPGTVLKVSDVYEHVIDYIERNHMDVRAFGYDPYNASDFLKLWCTENGEYGVTKVIQGSKTETVPLGEIKKLAEQKKLVFSQKILTYTMGNAITIEDTNGNRKLLKMRRDTKIDSVAALIDAYVAYKASEEAFD